MFVKGEQECAEEMKALHWPAPYHFAFECSRLQYRRPRDRGPSSSSRMNGRRGTRGLTLLPPIL